MQEQEIVGAALLSEADYKVTLQSVGNPDRGQNPCRSLPGLLDSIVDASSLAKASELCCAYISQHQLGAGNWSGGKVSLDGKTVARISYNGRVWGKSSSQPQVTQTSEPTPQYLLCVRGAKSKLYAVAGVTLGDQSCLRAAEIAFEKAGFDTRKMDTKWGEIVSKQKNFAGYAPDYKSIEAD